MRSPPSILVVDGERTFRWSVADSLGRAGYRVREADSAAGALAAVEEGVDLVLLEVGIAGADGLSLLEGMKAIGPDTVVIVMTALSSIGEAVQAMKQGAFHYVEKPVDVAEIDLLVEWAMETRRLRRETVRRAGRCAVDVDRIIGESPAMLALKERITRVAPTLATTLITGESGTGKDLVAQVMHHRSDRAGRRFMNITCSALPDALLESELFGHERGAFTDARRLRKGLLELSDAGTLFLDEVGEMSPPVQAKLLRFLEEKAIRRVGGTTDIEVDVRIVAATNRDLEADVRAGRFREDLYYRLAVVQLGLPPLRERPGDLPLLFDHFVGAVSAALHRPAPAIAPDALDALGSYAWPGNIRELRNVVERTLLFLEADTVRALDLELPARPGSDPAPFQLPAGGTDLAELERSLLIQALQRTRGNQRAAAALLGLHRDQVRYRMRKYGLTAGDGR
jgi:DNA-binding NtrC family response regulator